MTATIATILDRMRIVRAWSVGSLVAIRASIMIANGLAGKAAAAGVWGVRLRSDGTVGTRPDHELLFQRLERRGVRRGRTAMTIMIPPQHGQFVVLGRSSLSSVLSSISPVVGMSSRRRQSTSLAARWPLDMKP